MSCKDTCWMLLYIPRRKDTKIKWFTDCSEAQKLNWLVLVVGTEISDRHVLHIFTLLYFIASPVFLTRSSKTAKFLTKLMFFVLVLHWKSTYFWAVMKMTHEIQHIDLLYMQRYKPIKHHIQRCDFFFSPCPKYITHTTNIAAVMQKKTMLHVWCN